MIPSEQAVIQGGSSLGAHWDFGKSAASGAKSPPPVPSSLPSGGKLPPPKPSTPPPRTTVLAAGVKPPPPRPQARAATRIRMTTAAPEAEISPPPVPAPVSTITVSVEELRTQLVSRLPPFGTLLSRTPVQEKPAVAGVRSPVSRPAPKQRRPAHPPS